MPNALTLPTELTIYTVSELRSIWLEWLSEHPAGGSEDDDEFHVDAQAVDTVDAAGLQLLISLSRSLAERDRPLRLQNASGALVDACGVLGLSEWIAGKEVGGACP